MTGSGSVLLTFPKTLACQDGNLPVSIQVSSSWRQWPGQTSTTRIPMCKVPETQPGGCRLQEMLLADSQVLFWDPKVTPLGPVGGAPWICIGRVAYRNCFELPFGKSLPWVRCGLWLKWLNFYLCDCVWNSNRKNGKLQMQGEQAKKNVAQRAPINWPSKGAMDQIQVKKTGHII